MIVPRVILDHFESEFFKMIMDVRQDIITEYGPEYLSRYPGVSIREQDFPNGFWTGKCDIASRYLADRVEEFARLHHINLHVSITHGELRHNPRTPRRYWCYEHTWVEVTVFGICTTFYLDATCQQFKYIFDNIPSYYISIHKPQWFYPDRDNPRFNCLYHFRRKHPELAHKIDHVIVFVQDSIWGTISESIRKIFHITC